MVKRLAVIDGKSVFYRGYYAMPNLATKDGTPTGGVYGFISLALELVKKLKPDYVAVAWDKRHTNIRRRKEIYPAYKAGRKPAPEDFYAQIPILYELLEAFGWPLYELDDYEADDIMGAFALQAKERDVETDLITSDLDALQLVGPTTKVYAMKNGLSKIEEFDPSTFEKKYGLDVEQFLDLKALKGDASDNLPGVPGIGEKTAIQLLQRYGTLDNIYNHLDELKPSIAKKLAEGKELAYITKEVGRIWTDAPVRLDWSVADVNDIDLQKVAAIIRKLEFTSLLNRLPKNMQPNVTAEETALTPLKIIDWPEHFSLDGAKPALVLIHEGELWVSPTSTTAFHAPISRVPASVWSVLSLGRTIAYDAKALYHELDAFSAAARFNVYDLRQAAFLLDPLNRDRSSVALSHTAAPEQDKPRALAGFWQTYKEQQAAFERLPRLKQVAETMDFPLTYLLFRMEKLGVKVDQKALGSLSRELAEERNRLERQMYDMVGYEFNIASPSQLADVLFGKLQLPTAGIKRGKNGLSTGQRELDKLRGAHPIIELIERTRELAKLMNTYTDVLPRLADEHGRVHTTFNQDATSTGRLSSTNPNLQNIPVRSELGGQIRRAFVAEKGNVLVSADYSQFELRLAAALARDEQMIGDFNTDIDIHAKTASDIYGIPLEQVTKNQRRAAKVINFGVLYGMSPHGLSAAAGLSYDEAKQFIERYFELRQPIRRYIDETLRKAESDGYVETYFGRRRPTPDIKSSNFAVREAAKRAAANLPIQGTEADLMKQAMLRAERRLEGLGDQILQVHDSILVECPAGNAEKVSGILRETMENICPELKIRFKVDVSTGTDWGAL